MRSMTDLCFKGPEEQLRLTYNTQPAILTCSVAALKVLEEHEVFPWTWYRPTALG